MIVTIDGPAGSGKSTVARKLAAHLQIAYLDTGAMYRAVAYAVLQRGIDLSNAEALLQAARAVRLEVDCGPTHTRVRIQGQDVSEAIRTLAVSAATSHVARHEEIRGLLVEHQRRLGDQLGSLVSEGRDQGTVVFPRADSKFVLQASLTKRAERRRQEMIADGEDATIEAVIQNLSVRDEVDSEQWEPLLRSGQAVVIDTTHMSIHEVLDQMLRHLGRENLDGGNVSPDGMRPSR